MPVIVIGADTPVGEAVVRAVAPSAAEVRAFISDDRFVDALRNRGVKVALGDVSDSSHVSAAALNCFCAILVVEAATDTRERSFAKRPQDVVEGWAEAVSDARVHRTLWAGIDGAHMPFPTPTPEVATVVVRGDLEKAAREIAHLEGLRSIPT